MKGNEIVTEAFELLRIYALGLPEAYEEFPWGHSAFKVRGKAFTFMTFDEATREISLSCKLPESKEFALSLPFTEPTGYGLGKSGWVTSTLPVEEAVPIDMLKAWMAESYRAIAPKKLAAQLGGDVSQTLPKREALPRSPKRLTKPRTKPSSLG